MSLVIQFSHSMALKFASHNPFVMPECGEQDSPGAALREQAGASEPRPARDSESDRSITELRYVGSSGQVLAVAERAAGPAEIRTTVRTPEGVILAVIKGTAAASSAGPTTDRLFDAHGVHRLTGD